MGSHPVIFIRTDANQKIASGHMMRCLTIAEELRAQGAAVTFVLSDTESDDCLTAFCSMLSILTPYQTLILHSDFEQPGSELDKLKELLVSNHVDTILVDSYFVTYQYLISIKNICKTAYMDDLMAFKYPVDLIINYDLHPDTDFYKNVPVTLLGASYAPLRKQFQNVQYVLQPTPAHVFLSTGGTDPFSISTRLLEHLLKKEQTLSALTYHVIVHSLSACDESLRLLSGQHSNIILHENVADMALLMNQCDIAITAAGTTLYELCAITVPTITYSMSDNQMIPANDFTKDGCCLYAGDCRDNPLFINNITNLMNTLYHDDVVRNSLHQHMKKIHIGNGSSLIAKELL